MKKREKEEREKWIEEEIEGKREKEKDRGRRRKEKREKREEKEKKKKERERREKSAKKKERKKSEEGKRKKDGIKTRERPILYAQTTPHETPCFPGVYSTPRVRPMSALYTQQLQFKLVRYNTTHASGSTRRGKDGTSSSSLPTSPRQPVSRLACKYKRIFFFSFSSFPPTPLTAWTALEQSARPKLIHHPHCWLRPLVAGHRRQTADTLPCSGR